MILACEIMGNSEVGIYKRKQESKKKERKHAVDQENDQEDVKEKKKVFRIKNINQFYFQPPMIISVICRFNKIEYI